MEAPGEGVRSEGHHGQQPANKPIRATISRVTGRQVKGSARGLQAIDQLELQLPNGTTANFTPPISGTLSSAKFINEILPTSFLMPKTAQPVCPICTEGIPSAKEHVPQGSLGGKVMTMTCERCNNRLGSTVEAELQGWFDHTLMSVSFANEGRTQGRRRTPKIYYRVGSDGRFLLIIDGNISPEIKQMLDSGSFTMQYRPPDPQRYRIALLKHAYLAACLDLGYIPYFDEARAIRTELLKARDGNGTSRSFSSPFASRLKVYRSNKGRQGPPLALVVSEQLDSKPELLISLAGVLLVSWPFSTMPPRRLDGSRL